MSDDATWLTPGGLPPAAFSAPAVMPSGAVAAPPTMQPQPRRPTTNLALAGSRAVPAGAPQRQMLMRRPPHQNSLQRRAMGQEDSSFSGHLLGLSTLLVGIGSMVGLRFGGLQGGVAGALFGGAAVNLYRAASFSMKGAPEADKEAIVSGTYAVAAGALGGYILWKRPVTVAVASDTRQRSSATMNARRSCGIRPV